MMQTTILFVILALTIIYAAYTTIKQLRTLEASQSRRILDLMVIGAILYLLDFLMPLERGGQTIILRTAGLLIFLYSCSFEMGTVRGINRSQKTFQSLK